jgi:phosphatidylserine/phosphatidylglycerophosphate/cardiolipin synthase-like enzyme
MARLFGVIAFALICISGGTLYTAHQQISQSPVVQKKIEVANTDSLALITEPQDGMAPVEHLIEDATSSVDLVMYELNDKNLEALLATRAREGVTVRVILDNGYFGAGSAVNEEAFDYLQSNGVQVHWSPPYFALTHQKTLVIDDMEALVMTFNLSPQYYKSDRDFGVLDADPNDVAAIERTFDADWNGKQIPSQNGDDLVWSPNARGQLLSLIDGATSTLDVYNEEMEDPQIISALEQAAAREVNVQVDMTYSANWTSAFTALSDAGVHVRTYAANAPLYVHAKVVVADGEEAFVGSQNFSSTSLDQNRELGLVTSDPNVVASLARTFATDWQSATPFAE